MYFSLEEKQRAKAPCSNEHSSAVGKAAATTEVQIKTLKKEK